MKEIKIIEAPNVEAKFNTYPEGVRDNMYFLKDLILEVAAETEGIEELEESLKWGEPSYKSKHGSPIRMDWKPSLPDQYALYFNCQTHLVNTFRILFGDLLSFEKNRAIVFSLEDPLPISEVKACIRMALTYHKVKHKPLLGN